MMEWVKVLGIEVMMLIVDFIIGGNWECDLCIGFLILFKLNVVGFW